MNFDEILLINSTRLNKLETRDRYILGSTAKLLNISIDKKLQKHKICKFINHIVINAIIILRIGKFLFINHYIRMHNFEPDIMRGCICRKTNTQENT